MDDREALKQILETRSILKGDFTLVSGRKSSYYINGKMTTLHSKGLNLVARLMLDLIGDLEFDAIGGPTIGADPIVGALLSVMAERGMDKEGLLIRKASKEHGTKKLVEGNLKPGMKVVILEDVVTTGGSLLRAAEEVKAAGGEIAGIAVVVDREEGATEAIADAGYSLRSLFRVSELL
ncbi:MAG: orotate phosphoribosyltransferase [Candidatus Krumholzibacteriota bacterium]|nr:orotate phosphoribosyltransferase [Candidatus Krumholzibacteriota bacterium]